MASLDDLQAGKDGKVTVDTRGDIAILTFDCGQNRFNSLFVERVNAALDQVLSDGGVKVLLTTGTGKFYSNGMDLDWVDPLSKQNDEEYKQFLNKRDTLSARMLTFPIPTVAVINGHCYAQGAAFTLCHDYRVMQTGRGWWCLNEVFLGININRPYLGVFKSKLSGQLFHEACTLGTRYTAEQALAAGIVQRISPPEDLKENASRYARDILFAKGYDRDYLSSAKENNYQDVVDILRQSGLEMNKSKL